MHLPVHHSFPVLLALGLSLPVLSCGNSLGPNGEVLVAVEDNAFTPATLTITAGETVLWQWKGQNQHNVTWTTQAGGGNSATQASGSYSRTFSLGGTYDYYCSIHGISVMHGTVVVRCQ